MVLPYDYLGHLGSEGIYEYTFSLYFLIDLADIYIHDMFFCMCLNDGAKLLLFSQLSR